MARRAASPAPWYIPHVRTYVWAVAGLTLVACGRDRASRPAASTHVLPPTTAPIQPVAATGPEALVLRIPRAGGIAHVYDYDRLDSAIWESARRVPAVSRVLAFDDDEGAVAIVDARGAPRRIELRTGDVSDPPDVKLTALRSADGATIYGVSTTGVVTRLTATDVHPWTLRPPDGARDVVPQADGSVLIVGEEAGAVRLWLMRPPATTVLDSASLPRAVHLVRTVFGDRAYFASDSALEAVRTRDLQLSPALHFDHRLRAVALTPSGDRLFVALDSVNGLRVIDRYGGQDNGAVSLPGPALELRMDSLGRYLIVRPAHSIDSAWVVAIGTDRVVAHVRTAWTADLPFVGFDGSIAVLQGLDVVFLDPQSLSVRRTILDGARDYWIPLRWNGLRPRAPGLDQPVTFPSTASDTADSILAAIRQSQRDTSLHTGPPPAPQPAPSVVDSAQGRLNTAAPRTAGFTVQFAALLDPDSAHVRASRIVAFGQHAHVVATARGPATVYVVVLGPFPSRDAADAAARASRQPNPWVYEGAP
jgi:SPOR domain